MAKKTKLPSSGGINWKSRLGPAAVSAMLAACAAQTPPLVEAAQTGDLARVNQLLDAGANLNAGNDVGYTPLHVAAKRGREAVVVLLLEAGANPNAQDGNGETPLHEAARVGSNANARLLLDAGADPNISNDNHETVLDVAAATHSATYELLRRHGARHSWI